MNLLTMLTLLASARADPTPCTDQWQEDAVGILQAWARTDQLGLDAPLVAVLYGGFELNHTDLTGRVAEAHDWAANSPEVTVATGADADRGTLAASLVVGEDDGVVAGRGFLPEGRVVVGQIGDSSGNLSLTAAVEAMHAIAAGEVPGVGVLVTPIAATSSSQTLGEAVGELQTADIVVVLPAGDCDDCDQPDLDLNPRYPVSYQGPHLLKVAATSPGDELWAGTRYGARAVDLSAPGLDICGAGIDSVTASTTRSGTAEAAAITAAVAALVRAVYPDLSAAEVVALLRATARPIPAHAGLTTTAGMLDADRAFQAAIPLLGAPTSTPAELVVPVQNLGPEGTLTVFIEHHDELSIDSVIDPDGWTVSPIQPGDPITMADGSMGVAAQPGAQVTGTLPAGADVALTITVGGTAPGTAIVRAGAASPGADWMLAPVAGDTVDALGNPGLSVEIDPASHDSGDLRLDGTVPQPEGCTCTVGDRGGVGGGLLLAALMGLRRPRRRRPGD